jgi:hypothetical protein
VNEIKGKDVDSIATAMVSHQSRAIAAGVGCARHQSLSEMRKIVETWLDDAREYRVAMNKAAQKLWIKYFWDHFELNQLARAERSDLKISGERYERLVATLKYKPRPTVIINSGDHYSRAYRCDCKTHKEYPKGAVRRLYEANILNEFSSMGMIIHETRREYAENSLVSALMHEYRDYNAKLHTQGSVLVLTHPTSHFVVSKKDPFAGQCQHLLRSLCLQLLSQTQYAAGLELGLVTPAFLDTTMLPGWDATIALCTIFREIILNIALLVKHNRKPPQTISVIIDELDQFERYPDYWKIIQFFRNLCDELVYGQLDQYVHFTYILLHSQVAQIATSPYPNERQIFWDEIKRLCSPEQDNVKIQALETIVDCANAPPRVTLPAKPYSGAPQISGTQDLDPTPVVPSLQQQLSLSQDLESQSDEPVAEYAAPANTNVKVIP